MAFLAVAAGAFGAHGLKEKLAPEMLAVYETGCRYQMYHALALVLVGLLARQGASGPRALAGAGAAFLAGILLFSGSLYALALTGERWLGAVTPFGGLFFLLGWLLFLRAAWGRGSRPPVPETAP
jgi:uncharacterized membrane protein YgdD (TMEM256/DUF423 family)